jgi:hypothetical protein
VDLGQEPREPRILGKGQGGYRLDGRR